MRRRRRRSSSAARARARSRSTSTEMRAIQAHFRALGREPTRLRARDPRADLDRALQAQDLHRRDRSSCDGDASASTTCSRTTIKRATRELDRPWCVSVFDDNAGVIAFDDEDCASASRSRPTTTRQRHRALRRRRHRHRRRDPRHPRHRPGARPIANTDVFCFGPPDLPPSEVPEGLPAPAPHPARRRRRRARLRQPHGHPHRQRRRAASTPRYVGNPLVYCGTVGLMPRDVRREARRSPGDRDRRRRRPHRPRRHPRRDLLLGRAARGVARRSRAAPCRSATRSPRRRVLDALLRGARPRAVPRDHRLRRRRALLRRRRDGRGARRRGRPRARAAQVRRASAPTEIWISEAQERMVLAVPPENARRAAGDLRRGGRRGDRASARSPTPAACVLRYDGDAGRRPRHGLPARRPAAADAARRRWQPPAHRRPAAAPAATDLGATLLRAPRRRRTSPARSGSSASTTTRCRAARSSSRWSAPRDDGPGDAAVLQPLLGIAPRRRHRLRR